MVGRAWDTSSLPVDEQFAFWQEAVNQAFTTVRIDRRGPGTFHSRIAARQLGPLSVAWIVSQSQSVSRVAEDVLADAGGVVFLNLPLTPGTAAVQDDRVATLAAGDFAIVDSVRPFELSFPAPFRQMSVVLPRELLAEQLDARPELTGSRVDGRRGVGAVASGTIRALTQAGSNLDRQALAALGQHVLGLISLSLGSVSPASSTPRELLLRAALDELDRSLSDPMLAPPLVAARLGLSTRFLHQLFAERGESFSATVRSLRLARCRRDLLDPAKLHWSIARIALEHGYTDPSYMARAFKQRYGETPRELRAAIRRR